MKIVGIPVGTTNPRTNYEQTDPSKSDYLKGKDILDQKIADAKKTGADAKTAADNAQTAADNAKTAADNAKTAADNAKTAADNAQTAADNAQTAAENAKAYTDSKRKVFTTTLTTNDWIGDAAPYTQTIGIDGILETDRPHYSPVYDAVQEVRLTQKEAFAMVDDLDTADGSVTFTCFEDKPEVNIPIQMEVNR